MSDSLRDFMASDADGVFIIGHSSALVRLAGILLMFDPVWGDFPLYGGDYWRFVPSQVDCSRAVQDVSIVVVSHVHEDHLCAPVLASFDEPTSVHIAEERPKLYAAIDKALSPNVDCFTHPALKWVEVIDGVELLFVRHEYNGIDTSCFARNKRTGFTVYHGNDNFLWRASLPDIRKLVPKVDFAMLPYAFVHWWPHLQVMPEPLRAAETHRMNGESLQKAADFIEVFQPRMAVPFGASIFYNAGAGHVLNSSLSTPFRFPNSDCRVSMLAGDYYLSGPKLVRRQESKSEQAYAEMLLRELGTGAGEPLDLDFTWTRDFPAKPFKKRFQINGVDVTTTTDGQLHRFDFSREVFGKWRSGKMSFEEAIGTRRFRFIREPDIFDAKVFMWMNKEL